VLCQATRSSMRQPCAERSFLSGFSAVTSEPAFIVLSYSCGKTNGIIMFEETSCWWPNHLCTCSSLSVSSGSHAHSPQDGSHAADTWHSLLGEPAPVCANCSVGTLPGGLPALCRSPPCLSPSLRDILHAMATICVACVMFGRRVATSV
jgi:hypothetical protein